MKQAEIVHQNIWPTNFKFRKDLEYRQIEAKENARLSQHIKNFELVTKLAQAAEAQGSRLNACCIVRFEDLQVVSNGLDTTCRDDRSLGHAVMDGLANHASNLFKKELNTKNNDLTGAGDAALGKKPPLLSLEEPHPTTKPGIKGTSLGEGPKTEQLAPLNKCSGALAEIKEGQDPGSYLASGLVAYSFQEPCS